MPKNHTDKERFAAASSRIQTGILTSLFPRKRRRSSPSPFISHRVLQAVASRILQSLMYPKERYVTKNRQIIFVMLIPSLAFSKLKPVIHRFFSRTLCHAKGLSVTPGGKVIQKITKLWNARPQFIRIWNSSARMIMKLRSKTHWGNSDRDTYWPWWILVYPRRWRHPQPWGQTPLLHTEHQRFIWWWLRHCCSHEHRLTGEWE